MTSGEYNEVQTKLNDAKSGDETLTILAEATGKTGGDLRDFAIKLMNMGDMQSRMALFNGDTEG